MAHYYAPAWGATPADKAAYMAAHPEAVYHDYGSYVPSVNPSTDYQTIPVRKFDDPAAPFGGSTSRRDIILSRLGETYLIAVQELYQRKRETLILITFLMSVDVNY